MEIRQTRQYDARHRLEKSTKVIAALLGLSALCYIGILVLGHAGSSSSGAPELILESQRLNSGASAQTADFPATFGTATAAVPASSPKSMARDFDYFPDHYVNQATKNAEPIETF